MARRKAGDKKGINKKNRSAGEETSSVQAEHYSIAFEKLHVGGNVGGDVRIGHTIGYTAEQVSLLLKQITTSLQPKPFDGRCPYKGLEVFEEEDAELFFGRERLVTELVGRVKESRTVFITGPSGSGKSSLVRAGLIHALKQGKIKNSDRWLYETLKPGREPLKDLALAFSRLKSPELQDYFLARTSEPEILNKCAESVLSGRKDQHFVLFVDQFEEIFTQINSEEERLAFINMLAHAGTIESGRVIVLFAMRSDFVSNCATYPALNELLSQEFRQIGAMQPDELVSAIALPARHVGLPVEHELIAQIINDMKGEPDALPLMQFALKDLFDAKQVLGGVIALTLKDYLGHGGIHKSLERHADATFAKLSESEQELARSIFSGLIEIGRGTQDTKRTALFDELVPANAKAEDVLTVVQKLADARLIITDEQAGKDTVTISHEKLIEAWPWLKKLVNENRDTIALQNEIISDAKEWEDHKRDVSYLYSGARLANAYDQVTTKKLALSGLAYKFVQAGQSRQELGHKQQQRRLTILWVATVVALVIMGFLSYSAIQQADNAEEQAKIAQAQADKLMNLANIDQANKLLKEHNPDLAIALAMHTSQGQHPADEAHAVLLDAAYLSFSRSAYPLCQKDSMDISWVSNVDISPDNQWAAVGCFWKNKDKELSGIYRVQLLTGEIREHSVYGARIFSLAISPNGKQIIAGYSNSSAILWDIDGSQIYSLTEHSGPVNTVAFSTNGDQAVTASRDHSIILWDLKEGKRILSFAETAQVTDAEAKLTSASFSPDGKKIAFGDESGNIILWDISKNLIYHHDSNEKHSGFVLSVIFSSDSLNIFSSSADGTISIWDLNDSNNTLSRHNILKAPGYKPGVWVHDLTLFPDGNHLLSAMADGSILIWDLPSLQVIQHLDGHLDEVISLDISSDGTFLISGARDSSIRVWDLTAVKNTKIISLSESNVPSQSQDTIEIRDLSLLSNGDRVILGDSKGHIYIGSTGDQDFADGWQVQPSEGPITSIDVSADEFQILTGGINGEVTLWDLATHQIVQRFDLKSLNLNYGSVRSIDISPDGKTAIIGYENGEIILLELPANKIKCDFSKLTESKHTNIINSVRISPDGKHAASGSNDHTVMWWNLKDCTNSKKLYQHDSWVISIDFSPDGKQLASVSADGSAILWDIESGRQVHRLRLPDSDINPGLEVFMLSVNFSQDGHLLATSSANGIIGLWSAANGTLLRKYIHPLSSSCTLATHCFWIWDVKFSPNGDELWSGSADGTICSWPLINVKNTEELRAWIENNRYLRQLTQQEKDIYGISQ